MGIGFLLTNLGIPCIYYGTEQGFDGGGDRDHCVRECMFGGKWGAFDSTGVHFFDEGHPIYKGIAAIAKIRREQPALRYGSEHFCETSVDGKIFSFPADRGSTLAYTRELDSDVILVAMNLDLQPRNDFVALKGTAGERLIDLQGGPPLVIVDCPEDVTAVRVRLGGRQIRILKYAGGSGS
jgi:glycosidase